MRPYPSYKDSGVIWFGEIPNHWDSIKMKFIGQVIIGLSYKPENVVEKDNGILVLRSSNIQNGKPSFLDNVYVDSEIPAKLRTKKGDILICSRSGSRELIGKNCVINNEMEGMTFGVFMSVFRSKYWRFIYWILNSPIFKSQSGMFLTSTINQLTVSTLENFVVPFTKDENEQQQIVSFLDHKTQKIDKLIETTEKKIELLKESILGHVCELSRKKVTLIDQEKEWFQKLPEGWKTIPIRSFFETISVKNNVGERLLSVTQDRGVIYRDEQETSVMNPSGDTSHFKLVEPGDFIISLRSSEGGFELSDVRGIVSPVYTVLRPLYEVDLIFYKYLFKSENFIIELNRYITGIRDGKSIHFNDIKTVRIPIKDWSSKKSEIDVEILNHHKNIYKHFDYQYKRIKLLKEYRQSLISEVVTGKIDVRDEVVA